MFLGGIGACNPTAERAEKCNTFSGQMTISIENERETSDVIDSVRSTVKYACDQDIFVKSSSSSDLVKVTYLSPNPPPIDAGSPSSEIQVKKSRSIVPYAISGALIGLLLFLFLFSTVWYVRRKQQQRQKVNKDNTDPSDYSDDTGFQEPEYGNLGKQVSTQDVHRCMSMLCQQCRHLQQPTFLPAKIQQDKDVASI